jgi:hypothetical protein
MSERDIINNVLFPGKQPAPKEDIEDQKDPVKIAEFVKQVNESKNNTTIM